MKVARKSSFNVFQYSQRAIYAVVLFLFLLAGCTDSPTKVDSPSIELESVGLSIYESKDYALMVGAQEKVISRLHEAVEEGLDPEAFKNAFLSGEHQKAYRLIGFNTQEVEALEEKYFNAVDRLRENYSPEIVEHSTELATRRMENGDAARKLDILTGRTGLHAKGSTMTFPQCSFTDAQNDIRANLPSRTQHEDEEEGEDDQNCEAGAYVCAAGCGLSAATLLGGAVCGTACWCGFCPRAPC